MSPWFWFYEKWQQTEKKNGMQNFWSITTVNFTAKRQFTLEKAENENIRSPSMNESIAKVLIEANVQHQIE